MVEPERKKASDGKSVTPPLAAEKTRRPGISQSIFALLVGINLLWGGSSLAAKIALHSIPPMTLAFARFSCAALLMYATASVLKVDLRVARHDWGRFWAMGALGLATAYLLIYAGIRQTTATDAALIISTEPIFLAMLSRLFLREPMPQTKIAGIAAGVFGVYLVVAGGQEISGRAVGDLLILLGVTFEAGASILGKRLVESYPALSVITYQMMVGSIALAPFALNELWDLGASGLGLAVTPAALVSLLYLVIPCTVLAYAVWFTLLEKRNVGDLAIFLFIQPVAGAALGALFLHEKITVFTLLGAAFVLCGVALLHRRKPDLSPPTA